LRGSRIGQREKVAKVDTRARFKHRQGTLCQKSECLFVLLPLHETDTKVEWTE